MLIHHREVSLHFAAVLFRGIVNFEEIFFGIVSFGDGNGNIVREGVRCPAVVLWMYNYG